MDLSNIGIFFLIGVLFFICGAVCVYIPFRNLKRRIVNFIKTADLSLGFSKSLLELDVVTQLQRYVTQVRNKTKHQSDQFLFLQQKMDVVTSVIKEAIIILDEKGQMLFHNPQSCKIFSLEEQKQVHYLNEITRSPDIINIFKQCIQQGNVIKKECIFGKKNQYIKSNFQVTAVPIIYKEMGIKNIALLFYDQTDIKESQQAHIDFVSNVSHELKTPLTAIQGYVEMLIHDCSQGKFDQFGSFLQILLRNSKRMGDLVDDLLSLSNLTSQAYLEKKRLNTKEITSRVVKQIEPIGHKLHYFFSAPYVMANPTWVETILYNLMDNACRHTPKDSDVYVRWEKMKDRVVLKVIDNGEGISEKYKQRIFERFFRIDSARSRKRGGTGVGLALVKQCMEKHGGCVRVASVPSGGTEFICEFPNA